MLSQTNQKSHNEDSYFVEITGVQFRTALVDITTVSALKYSAGDRGSVELKGILSLGGAHGASVTMVMMSSNCSTSVTLFLAITDTLKIPNLL